MQLKEFQQGVLRRLDSYLAALRHGKSRNERAAEVLREQGLDTPLPDFCEQAWKQLNDERLLPYLSVDGVRRPAPWLTRTDGLGRSIPNVCLKVPTGGGKTLLASASVERIQTDYFRRQTGLVLWIVPSEAIYRQTWKQLANREHPYRQMLERASGGRVKLLEKTDAFTRQDADAQLCVMLLMLPAANRVSKETLRLFRDSGRFTSFFPAEDDGPANAKLLETTPNLDRNDLIETMALGGAAWASLSVRQSLGNVLKLVQPLIVIDEGHRAYSENARQTLHDFNPRFMLELSATPNTNNKHQSNVLVNVSGSDLKNEEMIKLPINLINEAGGGWKHALSLAHEKQAELEQAASTFQADSGRYIRPIVLVRVERTGKDQRDAAYVHAEDAREYLRAQLGVNEEHIRLKTSESDEIGDEDLLDPHCPVRYIITKDALREGWDCPFAYILAILSKTTANTALTQMIGRVLRQPHAQATGVEVLDECYVYTFDQDVSQAVDNVRSGLQSEGMGDLASAVKGLDAGTDQASQTRREVIPRRECYRNLPPIFLPRILHRDASTKEGWRELDYDRDILSALDWNGVQFTGQFDVQPAAGPIRRTIARVNLDEAAGGAKGDLTAIEFEEEAVAELPDEGLDKPFLVRQLLDSVPNPWQALRILDQAIDQLEEKGLSLAQIYSARLDLILALRQDIKHQVNSMAERVFLSKLDGGEIALKLAASRDSKLNWALAETLEVDVTDSDRVLRRKNGQPLEKSLYETVYTRDFNELEKNTAWYLDEHRLVYWWHRLAVNQRSWSVQGWQRHRVYPDLIACIRSNDDGSLRFSVLETKGEHLKGNDDTEYKRRLFELLTEHMKTARTVGELTLDGQMQFEMLLEDQWQPKVEAALTRAAG